MMVYDVFTDRLLKADEIANARAELCDRIEAMGPVEFEVEVDEDDDPWRDL